MKIRFSAGKLNRVYEIVPTLIVVNDAVYGVSIELHWMGVAVGILFAKKRSISGHE